MISMPGSFDLCETRGVQRASFLTELLRPFADTLSATYRDTLGRPFMNMLLPAGIARTSEVTADALTVGEDSGRHSSPARSLMPTSGAALYMGCLLAGALLAQVGCSSLKVKLGMRVDLTQTPVASIEASLFKSPGMAPGQTASLVVIVTQPDGKILQTEGKGGGKVQWKDLSLATNIVTSNQKGVLSLSKDPRVSDGKVGHVTVTVPSHPDVKPAELDIHFRYDVNFVSNFSGAPGASGMTGTDGIDGISGSSGSMDPNSPSPGGNGTSGTNGSDGGDGGTGGDAPRVQVLLTVQPGTPLLIQASVSALGKRRLYLVNPVGGSLTIKADGGPGGSGGRGGRGGRGGAGGMGSPSGSSGSDGADGRSGFDGSLGKGGQITATYDPTVQPYLGIIHLSSKNGPTPELRQSQVSLLW